MMDEIFLYGSRRADIDTLAGEIGDALGVVPEAHDSSFFGAYYSFDGAAFEARIEQNMDAPEEAEENKRYQYPSRKDLVLMMEITITGGDPEQIKKSIDRIAGMDFLRTY